jgi:hypothetical protein
MTGWILTEIIGEFFIWKTSDLTQGVSQYSGASKRKAYA